MQNEFFTKGTHTPNKTSNGPLVNITNSNRSSSSSSALSSLSTSALFEKSSSSSNSGDDTLLQARIAHLEKDRVDLSMKLQLGAEKERARKLKFEQMENQIRALTEKAEKVEVLKQEKESLEKRVFALSSAAATSTTTELMTTSTSGDSNNSGSIWNKMTAASRERQRIEDEAKELRRERDETHLQNAQLLKESELLKEKIEKDSKSIIILREAAVDAQNKSQEILEMKEERSELSKQLHDEQLQTQEFTKAAQIQDEENQRLREVVEELSRDLSSSLEREKNRKQFNPFSGGGAVGSVGCSLLGTAAGGDFVLDGSADQALLVQLVEDLRNKLHQSEIKRKQLHNALQDLRGNVRVLVRMRPFMKCDGEDRDSSMICNKDKTSISVSATAARGANSMFNFDQVFDAASTQEDVYKEVKDLVQSSLDGYRVCIFSYGQTGSGKTWTMSGDRNGSSRGIIPRSVEQLIENSIEMRAQGWEVSISASVVELYNEELRDLLPSTCSSSSSSGSGSSTSAKDKDKLKISNLQGRVTVAGLTQTPIDSTDTKHGLKQLEAVIIQSCKARATATTGMNEHSSRSHVLFVLDVVAKHKDGTTITKGGLRLVDLAGSERLDRTGTLTDAARLRETVNINKSLSCLADVFSALSQKASHVPFRNSKLTMLLQDCLSGDGKALMIVNVSPTQASTHESLCSLRFAGQVSQVEMGKAQKQIFIVQQQPPPPPTTTTAASFSSASSSSSSTSSSSSSSCSSSSILTLPLPPPPPVAFHTHPFPVTIASSVSSIEQSSQGSSSSSASSNYATYSSQPPMGVGCLKPPSSGACGGVNKDSLSSSSASSFTSSGGPAGLLPPSVSLSTAVNGLLGSSFTSSSLSSSSLPHTQEPSGIEHPPLPSSILIGLNAPSLHNIKEKDVSTSSAAVAPLRKVSFALGNITESTKGSSTWNSLSSSSSLSASSSSSSIPSSSSLCSSTSTSCFSSSMPLLRTSSIAGISSSSSSSSNSNATGVATLSGAVLGAKRRETHSASSFSSSSSSISDVPSAAAALGPSKRSRSNVSSSQGINISNSAAGSSFGSTTSRPSTWR